MKKGECWKEIAAECPYCEEICHIDESEIDMGKFDETNVISCHYCGEDFIIDIP